MDILYKPNNKKQTIEPIDSSYTIEELKELMLGDVELVYLVKSNSFLVLNKEYANEKLGFNEFATTLYHKSFPETIESKIYGNALITTNIN
jgi:hypothetical protein